MGESRDPIRFSGLVHRFEPDNHVDTAGGPAGVILTTGPLCRLLLRLASHTARPHRPGLLSEALFDVLGLNNHSTI